MTRDQERFEELFERCYDALLAYAVRRTQSPEDAADVVSDTFAAAWRRIRDVPSGDDARLWLYGTARRTLSTHRRGSLRREALDERLLTHARILQARAEAAADTSDALMSALASLTDADQELLRLVAWEDLDGPQIAQVLGISATAVRVRLHRARQRLRNRLESRGGTGLVDLAATAPGMDQNRNRGARSPGAFVPTSQSEDA